MYEGAVFPYDQEIGDEIQMFRRKNNRESSHILINQYNSVSAQDSRLPPPNSYRRKKAKSRAISERDRINGLKPVMI